MASLRAWIILAALTCMLLTRPAAAQSSSVAATTAEAAASHPCDPTTGSCHPGDPRAPENQEEEAPNNLPPGTEKAAMGGPDDMEEFQGFAQELVVLGH
ncbi:hypothetical protein C4D60_Mb04t04080 [Musa balbisiana]|uniref:Uncharacterized protein n=1 Tax=Musa balbisiana TaxID=52838 RepID=A0A4S8K9H9_MUSBA|nr:hypothetical protein C4D60_Mb04t04080 [Musa balbisiana]